MTSQEPRRWAELGAGAPEAMQVLLDAARRDLPGTAELRAMGIISGVAAPIGSGVEETTGPTSKVGTSKAATSKLAAASNGAAAGGGNATTGTLALARKLALLAKVGTAGLVVVGGTTLLLNVYEPDTGTAVRPPQAGGAQISTIDALRSGAASELTRDPQAEPSAARLDPEAPQPTDSTLRTTEPTPDATELTPSDTPVPGSVDRTPGRASRPAVAASEARLLQRAQSLLAQNPERALELAQQHAKQFPQGQLAQEREVIRIEALRRLGREGQAEKVGRDFEQRFPDSPHRRKLDQSSP
jgi:hypothetical protein